MLLLLLLDDDMSSWRWLRCSNILRSATNAAAGAATTSHRLFYTPDRVAQIAYLPGQLIDIFALLLNGATLLLLTLLLLLDDVQLSVQLSAKRASHIAHVDDKLGELVGTMRTVRCRSGIAGAATIVVSVVMVVVSCCHC